MKVNFKNCWKEISSSYETGAFIVIIVEREQQITIAGKCYS